MKISRNMYVNEITKSYNKKVDSAVKATGVKNIQDKIEISDVAREVQVATKAFKKLPEIRSDLVKHLKEAITSGAYKISAEDVAKKMLSVD